MCYLLDLPANQICPPSCSIPENPFFIIAKEQFAQVGNMLFSVIEVDDMGSAGEVCIGKVFNALCASRTAQRILLPL